jgi:hypothetical protein
MQLPGGADLVLVLGTGVVIAIAAVLIYYFKSRRA